VNDIQVLIIPSSVRQTAGVTMRQTIQKYIPAQKH